MHQTSDSRGRLDPGLADCPSWGTLGLNPTTKMRLCSRLCCSRHGISAHVRVRPELAGHWAGRRYLFGGSICLEMVEKKARETERKGHLGIFLSRPVKRGALRIRLFLIRVTWIDILEADGEWTEACSNRF